MCENMTIQCYICYCPLLNPRVNYQLIHREAGDETQTSVKAVHCYK